jgi:hypothetical protein
LGAIYLNFPQLLAAIFGGILRGMVKMAMEMNLAAVADRRYIIWLALIPHLNLSTSSRAFCNTKQKPFKSPFWGSEENGKVRHPPLRMKSLTYPTPVCRLWELDKRIHKTSRGERSKGRESRDIQSCLSTSSL